MRPDIFWIPGIEPHRLALMPRPRAGDWLAEEIAGWRAAGIDTVVSCLERSEVDDLGLANEPVECATHTIDLLSFPIPDRGLPPSIADARALVQRLVADLREGRSVAVHCRMGIGRSGVIAACVLCELGAPLSDVFQMLSRARGVSVPDTEEQAGWVRGFVRGSV